MILYAPIAHTQQENIPTLILVAAQAYPPAYVLHSTTAEVSH